MTWQLHENFETLETQLRKIQLNVILGMTQLIQRNQDLSSKSWEHLESILRSGNQLLLLVNRLIKASKLETNRPSLAEQKFDLVQLLDDVKAIKDQQANAAAIVSDARQYDDKKGSIPATLTLLPDKLQADLYGAVEVADFDMTMNVIEQIRYYDALLAETLAKVVNQYRFDILHALFEEGGTSGERVACTAK